MKKVKSKSEKRLIIEVIVNGNKANMLVDTGASVGMIDSNQKKKYQLKSGKDYPGTLVGAGGEMRNIKYCDTLVEFEDKLIPQFLLADLSPVVKSIKNETGIEILGIISLSQCKMTHLSIDCDDNEIIIE